MVGFSSFMKTNGSFKSLKNLTVVTIHTVISKTLNLKTTIYELLQAQILSFSQATQKEIEKQKVHLKSVTELGEALKTVLGKKETLVEDKLSLLNSNWIAVTSRAEEWLNLLLVREEARGFSTPLHYEKEIMYALNNNIYVCKFLNFT